MEVPSHGIYCADLKQGTLPDSFTLFPWCYSSPDHGHCTPSLEQCVLFNQNLTTSLCGLPVHCASYAVTTAFCELNQREPDPDVANHLKLTGAKVPPLNPESSNPSLLESVVVPEQSKLAEKLIEILGEAVRVRVECQSQVCHRCMPAYLDKLSVPADNNHCSSLCDFNYCGHARTAVLFSGGIDSLVVAALAHRYSTLVCNTLHCFCCMYTVACNSIYFLMCGLFATGLYLLKSPSICSMLPSSSVQRWIIQNINPGLFKITC